MGAQNYQIRNLGNFNQIWQKMMTASHDLCQMDPVKKCPENVIKLLTRMRVAKKIVFYAFYGILGAGNYQIRYLGIFIQIWQKIMTAVSRFVSDGPRKEMS